MQLGRTFENRKGFTLIEIIVCLAILGIISVGVMVGLASSSKATISADQLDTGRALAESQMEYVKKMPFTSSYSPDTIPASYTGYSVSIGAVPAGQRDSLIQLITITVQRYGNTVTTLEDCKTRR
jgi:prepilin-type N-terminal cleavage/methylation domain-containing protein